MEPPQRATQRWALGLEYRGTAFCGWQRQVAQPSVQQALERALSQIAQTEVSVIAAGRTDTGVHASLQVVHFDATVERLKNFDIDAPLADKADTKFHPQSSRIKKT